MKLTGEGPWGAEEVANATGLSRRTLTDWCARGWVMPETIGRCHRFRRSHVRRVCALAALKEAGIPRTRISFIAKAIAAKELATLEESCPLQ